MECAKCGQALMEGAIFCPYCGEKVAVRTPEEAEGPLYQAEVKSLLKSGTLTVYRDRVEFATSSVQKMIFNYTSLVAVKKGLDRILFITEDGRTESCPANRKTIHEAFLYIDQASRPYIAQRNDLLQEQGIQYSLVSGQGLTSGVLNIMDDRAEFKAKSGQVEVVCYQNVKSVSLSMGLLEFSLIDGTAKAFSVGKEVRDEVLAFVEKAVEPHIAARKEALLAKGIYFTSLSSQGSDGGTLDVLGDRVEFRAKSGRSESVFYPDVRVVRLSAGMLELALTNGSTRAFTVEGDVGPEIVDFVEQAIQPYVLERTVGFDAAFGVDERIEFNDERGVFHIIRQGGNEITGEYPIASLTACEWTESTTSDSVLGGVLSGGMAFLNSAARAVGPQNGPKTEESIRSLDVTLTISAQEEVQMERVRFGDFLLGMSRTNKKYDRYLEEVSKLTDYLSSRCPMCQLIAPALPELELELEPVAPVAEAGGRAVEVPQVISTTETTLADPADTAVEKDQFGIIKYIDGVSEFMDDCATPMTIAIQGSWGSGKNGIMDLLGNRLEGSYPGNLIWFHTWQFSQFDLGEQLPMLVGNRLVGQLSGSSGAATKDRAIKVAKGLLEITTGIISQGTSDGQNLMEAFFRDNSADSLEKLVRNFSALAAQRAGMGKVVILVDDLDRLAPAKAVELLEAMRNFFDCEGCVFVVAVDYNSFLRGAMERYGQDFDESKGKRLFDSLFQVSFRVPTSGFHIQNYVKDKLAHLAIEAKDEAELESYVELIKRSVGYEPKSMDRLFNSFLLLKKLADSDLYADRHKRLMLFALICLQASFHGVYDYLVRMKNRITPQFLSGLSSDGSEVWSHVQLSDEEQAAFGGFAQVFCDVINTDKMADISQAECGVFEEVLEFSSITSK